MKVENWSIDKVKPYQNNPRNNDDAVEATANSIQQFGWQQPIVVDKNGVIIIKSQAKFNRHLQSYRENNHWRCDFK